MALLQALLLATLERLEGVEAVVAAADATSAAMEDKVSGRIACCLLSIALHHHPVYYAEAAQMEACICTAYKPALTGAGWTAVTRLLDA